MSATDLSEARRFLQLLDPTATSFTFQTFQDLASGVNATKPDLARVINGSVEDALLRHLYECGSGVWVTVNRTDLRGRKAHNITDLRAVWQEEDGGHVGALPLEPSIVVESSPGKFHRYWLTGCAANDRARLEHRAVMERMVTNHGSDKSATDICRVLRVPGFLHRKAKPFMVRIVEATGHRYPWAEILGAFPPIPRRETATHCRFEQRDGDDERIAEALSTIPADDRAVWIDVGLALQGHYGDRGRDLWDRWSQSSTKYDAEDLERVWKSFKGAGTTIRTVFYHAVNAGWSERRIWSTAGHFLDRFEPTKAWRLFSTWCGRNGAAARAAEIFKTVLEKELMR